MFLFNLAFAENTMQNVGGSSMLSGLGGMLPMVLIMVVFYFLLIRPQSKKQQKLQEMINNLAKNDVVVVAGGIVGTIYALDEKFVDIHISKQAEMRVLRTSVNEVITDSKEAILPKKKTEPASDSNKNVAKKKSPAESKKKTPKEE
jgi:preprotein translocase subunit YajC